MAFPVRSVRPHRSSNYNLFQRQDPSIILTFVYFRMAAAVILLLNYCLRLPRSVRSTQVREAGAALISVAVYGSAAASAPVSTESPQTSAQHISSSSSAQQFFFFPQSTRL